MNKELTIMYLNVHGGITFEPLAEYLVKMSSEVDIFCFQEVPSSPVESWEQPHPNGATHSLYQKLERILLNFQGYYLPCQSNRLEQDSRLAHQSSFGLSTFVARKFSDVQISSKRIFQPKHEYGVEQHGTVPRDILCTLIRYNNVPLMVANVHGLWDEKGKVNTNERLSQSKAIHNAIRGFPKPWILGGDFNLEPNTESLRMFEERFGMRNLIKEYQIDNTRSLTQYKKVCRFADYVFTDSKTEVVDFTVDRSADDVSDHLPLIVTVCIQPQAR